MVGLSPNTKYTFTLQLDKRKSDQTPTPRNEENKIVSKQTTPEIKIDLCENKGQNTCDLNLYNGRNGLEDAIQTPDRVTSKDESEEPLLADETPATEDYKNDISCSTNTELEVTFITEKCGKHDARLISAIENHDMGEVRRICSMSPEVRYSMKRLKTARKHETSERYVKYT